MNTVYRIGVLLAIVLSSLTGWGQSRSYHIYDEYSNKEGFTYFAFSKAMIDFVNMTLDEENKKVTGDLNEIRVLVLNKEKSSIGGSLPNVLSGKLEKLDYKKVKPKNSDNSDDVEFWIEGDGKKVKECHVIVKDKEDSQFSCMVSFYGNFKVEDLESLERFSRKQSKKDSN